MEHVITPHGGTLVDLMVDDERAAELRAGSREWPSWDLDQRQVCDLELLLCGGFSPLDGYLDASAHAAVCDTMRLPDGTLWPVPITLDIDERAADKLTAGAMLALRDLEGVMLAAVTVSELYRPDVEAEIAALFGAEAVASDAARSYRARRRPVSVAGRVEGIEAPTHYDFRELRSSPADLRALFAKLGWRRVLAFQTHQTLHRAQHETTQRAALDHGANLLLHPLVGLSQPGDADHYTRIRCFQALLPHYPKYMARMSLLPLAPRHAGPREALWHALVHKNHGCSHVMFQPNHRTTVLETSAAPAWDVEEAAELAEAHADELGINVVRYREMVYFEQRRRYVRCDDAPPDAKLLFLDGSEVRRRLDDGRPLPEWFTYASVERELQHRHPSRDRQGFTVFFTGLSGSGKSTIANALRVKLMELGGRGITLLDGDLVRKNLSSELGFSKEHRDLNIRRIGFVASEITRAGGIAICAPIAPYDNIRKEVRAVVAPCGGFVLVHASTPLEVCEARDRKGMYAKARAGIIKEFTGISDPYEEPADAEVTIDTSDITPEEAVREVLLFLAREGYLVGSEES